MSEMTAPPKSFVTLSGEAEHRLEVKGSIFLALGRRADSPAEVNRLLHTLASRHPDASHLCWAYRTGQEYRFSDAGEPGGTAGQPILRAIEGQGLDHVAVGVIRYFGGTLLGAGGLMRAYGGVAAEALRTAARCEVFPKVEITIHAPFEQMGAVFHLLDTFQGENRREAYTAEGIQIRASVPVTAVQPLATQLQEATRGQGRVETAK